MKAVYYIVLAIIGFVCGVMFADAIRDDNTTNMIVTGLILIAISACFTIIIWKDEVK